MALVRLQPFPNITNLHRGMDRLFDNIVDRSEAVIAPKFVPAAEMYADEDNLYLRLEVPGLKPEEIEVQANAYAVTISGERQEEKNSGHPGLKRSEFRYGKFHRTVNFSEKIQVDAVTAKYEHGILQLTFPKADEEKNKTIKVMVGTEQLPELN